jgi:hypothetical protein
MLDLEHMWRIRNDLAHGFSVEREDAPQPADVAKHFAATGRRLLSLIGPWEKGCPGDP